MAFANAAGGKLVVGIEDDGAVTGFKREKAIILNDKGERDQVICTGIMRA